MQGFFLEQALSRPKRERTKAAFHDGVVTIVSQKGLDTVTVKDVMRATAFSQGTFYNHFDDRKAVVVSTALEISKRIENSIRHQVCELSPGLGRLIVAVNATINEAVRYPDQGILLSEAMGVYPEVTDFVRPNIRADLRAAKQKGLTTIDSNQVTEDHVGLLVGHGIRSRLTKSSGKKINRQTSEAILRLLGVASTQVATLTGEYMRLLK